MGGGSEGDHRSQTADGGGQGGGDKGHQHQWRVGGMCLRIVTLPGWLLPEPSELALQMLERGNNFRRLATARYSAINGKRDLYLNRNELLQ